MRLFVAVVPPAEAIDHLESRGGAGARPTSADLQWIPTERWHLTLAFYGEVADGESLAARGASRGAGRCAASRRSRWRSPGSGRSAAGSLWVGVAGRRRPAARAGRRRATDGRPYRPHLTVARVRGGHRPAAAAEALSAYAGPSGGRPRSVLVRSHLGPAPRHEVLAAFPPGRRWLGSQRGPPDAPPVVVPRRARAVLVLLVVLNAVV